METRRWTNPSQPQTLYMAHLLLYFSAAFNLVEGLLFGSGFDVVLPSYIVTLSGDFASRPSLTLIGLEVVAGYLIANERKWGWWLGLAAVALALFAPAAAVIWAGPRMIFRFGWILSVVFPGALLVLLVHPMSRDYQRIWFK